MIEDIPQNSLVLRVSQTSRDICLHGIDRILCAKQTAYQQIYIVESASFGKSLILDGDYQSSTVDEFIYHEHLVHPAMLACGKPKRVLILGGGEGATLREVLRWKSLEKAVMVDIDRDVIDLCRQYLPEMSENAFDDRRSKLSIEDAMAFLDRCEETFDVVITDLTDPVEAGPSCHLFTQESFQKIRRFLNPGGCFVIQGGSVDRWDVKAFARLTNTIQALFPNVLPYTCFVSSYFGIWGFILASDRPLDAHPDPETIDRILQTKITGKLREWDGVSWLGSLQLPRYIRNEIARETQIYTLAEPPKLVRTRD